VKVGAPIAILAGEGEMPALQPKLLRRPIRPHLHRQKAAPEPKADATPKAAPPPQAPVETPPAPAQPAAAPRVEGERIQGLAAGEAARAGAGHRSLDHPGQRPGRADRPRRPRQGCWRRRSCARRSSRSNRHAPRHAGPFELESRTRSSSCRNVRKTIARRLTESKQQIPHIYLTVDIDLDALLKLRSELNKGLESRNIKLSVNDLMIKALAMALIEVAGVQRQLRGGQSSQIQPARTSRSRCRSPAASSPDRRQCRRQERLGDRDRDPRPRRARQGRQSSSRANIRAAPRGLSNMGMYGIKNFEAVINPPGHDHGHRRGRKSAPTFINDSLQIETVMSATAASTTAPSTAADGARLNAGVQAPGRNPLGMLA